MCPNRVKDIRVALASPGWLITPSAHVTEVMAHQEKLAALSLTCQHSLIEYQPVLGMLRTLPTTEAVPLARIPLE
jgi:2-keto-3-deoxy-L-rhamnonate aldolase RhmA